MFKKPFVPFAVSVGGFELSFSAALFPSAEQSEGAFEEIAKLEKYDGRSVGIITPSGIRGQQTFAGHIHPPRPPRQVF